MFLSYYHLSACFIRLSRYVFHNLRVGGLCTRDSSDFCDTEVKSIAYCVLGAKPMLSGLDAVSD